MLENMAATKYEVLRQSMKEQYLLHFRQCESSTIVYTEFHTMEEVVAWLNDIKDNSAFDKIEIISLRKIIVSDNGVIYQANLRCFDS